MKAIVYEKYGSPDVFQFREIPKPIPKDKEVLVKIMATAVNDWDWLMMKSDDFANRMINGLFRPKKFKVLGCDIAGIVESCGKNVEKFKPGDEVYGDISDSFGGFAEFACANENALLLKPKNMDFVQAASIPQAGALAVQGLIDVGKIRNGQKILVNGAGGGVGSIAIQIAKSFDCEVTGVDNSGKLDFMRNMGYDHVIDFQKEDFTKNGEQYDMILDQKTSRNITEYLKSLTEEGQYLTTGGSNGKLFQIFTLGSLINKFSKKSVKLVMLKTNKGLAYLNDLYDKNQFKPHIGKIFSLENTLDAFRQFDEGAHQGKLVIQVDSF